MKKPASITGYLYLLKTIDSVNLNELKGFKNIPKEAKAQLICLSADISNSISEFNKKNIK